MLEGKLKRSKCSQIHLSHILLENVVFQSLAGTDLQFISDNTLPIGSHSDSQLYVDGHATIYLSKNNIQLTSI